MLKVVDARRIGNQLYRVFSYLGLLFALVVVAFGHDLATAGTAVAINLIFARLNAWPRYRRLPGMIVLAFYSLIYVQLPLAYFSLAYEYYDFGASVMIPRPSADYREVLPRALWFYLATYLCLIAGMILASMLRLRPARHSPVSDGWPSRRLSANALLVGAVVVAAVSINDIANIFIAQSLGDEKAESVIALILNDRAYLTIFPVLFYVAAQRPTYWLTKAQFVLGLLALLLVNLFATSKGAILTLGTSFFIYPVALFYLKAKPVYWPRSAVLWGAVLMSVPLYFIALVDRQFRMSGGVRTLDGLRTAVLTVIGDSENSILDQIATRLTVNLNNFVLLFTEFRGEPPPGYRVEVASYIWHSFLNMVLLGTPYPDAYTPSSQQFPNILQHLPLAGDTSKAALLVGANTQPMTLFGVLMVVGGPVVTLIASFAVGWLYVKAYEMFDSALNRTIIVFGFIAVFGCYGIEGALQFSAITAVSAYLVLWVLSMVSSKRSRSRSAGVQLAAVAHEAARIQMARPE